MFHKVFNITIVKKCPRQSLEFICVFVIFSEDWLTLLMLQLQRLQVPRPLTVSWNCDGTRLAAGAEKSVSVITFDSSFRIVSIYNIDK